MQTYEIWTSDEKNEPTGAEPIATATNANDAKRIANELASDYTFGTVIVEPTGRVDDGAPHFAEVDAACDAILAIDCATVRNEIERTVLDAFDGQPADFDETRALANRYCETQADRDRVEEIIRSIDLDLIRSRGTGGAA